MEMSVKTKINRVYTLTLKEPEMLILLEALGDLSNESVETFGKGYGLKDSEIYKLQKIAFNLYDTIHDKVNKVIKTPSNKPVMDYLIDNFREEDV